MKKKLLSTAIAAVSLAGFSHGALALNIATTQPDLEIFMSGASAQDGAITALFKNLCGVNNPLNNTLDIYRQGTNHTAYFCTLSAADVPGLSGPKKILFHKRSSGGSGQGVTPVLAQTPIQHLNINRGATNPCTAHATLANEWVCAATTTDPATYTSASWTILPRGFDFVTKTSDSGISDVEPAMFKGVNKPNDAAADFADPTNLMTVKAGASLVFGVPVSDNLYVALQQAQGLLATSANSTGVNCLPGAYGKTGAFPVAGAAAYTEPTGDECMPSLTKNQVATLFAGQVKKWSELKVDHDNNVGTLPVPLTDAAIVSPGGVALAYNDYDLVAGAIVVTPRTVAPTDASNNVRVCKRIEGSGTGAVAYANFLNAPCSTTAMSPEFNTNPTGPVKHEVSGSGDMANCLEDWADGENVTKTITTTGNPDVFNTAMNTTLLKAWAIGHQSTENNAKHNRHYRFVKIDGVAPTVQNVFKGKYINWAEATFQYNGSGVGAPAGDSKLIIDKIAADAASPAIIASDLNPNFVHAFGQGGYLASNKTNTYLATFNLASPVNAYSHAPGTLAPSSCRVPVMPLPTTVAPINAEKPF